jgi:hypothetical protein
LHQTHSHNALDGLIPFILHKYPSGQFVSGTTFRQVQNWTRIGLYDDTVKADAYEPQTEGLSSNFRKKSCVKTLFLDFDGVLHPTSGGQPFSRLPLLEAALSGYECDIVISSSWRHHHSLQELVEHFPATLRRSVVGTTGPPYIGKWPRYQEILNYCQANGVRDWVALDDSFLEFPSPCKELILCNPNTGIDAKQLTALKQWLEH